MRTPGSKRSGLVLVLALILAMGAPLSACQACDHCDRSTRAGSREDPYIRTALPGGAVLMTERPVIPEDMRANCHVCPEWCEQIDLRPLPIDVVLATYRRHALLYADSVKDPYPAGWATLEQMSCIVAGGGPYDQERFVALLRDPNPAIRFPAAVHTLQHQFDTAAALAVLRNMAGGGAPGEERASEDTPAGPNGEDRAISARIILMDHESGIPIVLP